MGYLVCDKCGGYYELQSGETPEDFTTECECGGKLAYSENLDDGGELSNEHMNTIHCIHCGTENPDYANFCQECGKNPNSEIIKENELKNAKSLNSPKLGINLGNILGNKLIQVQTDLENDLSLLKEFGNDLQKIVEKHGLDEVETEEEFQEQIRKIDSEINLKKESLDKKLKYYNNRIIIDKIRDKDKPFSLKYSISLKKSEKPYKEREVILDNSENVKTKLKVEIWKNSISIPDIKFSSISFLKTKDDKYILAYNDSHHDSCGGTRRLIKGKTIFINQNELFIINALERPNDGKLAENGTFIINDWVASSVHCGIFYVFNSKAEVLLKSKFNSNLYHNGICESGKYAVVETLYSESDDQNKIFFYDLNNGELLWERERDAGNIKSFNFDENKNILTVYYANGINYRHSFNGEFLDNEKLEKKLITRANGYELFRRAEEKMDDLDYKNSNISDYDEVLSLLLKASKKDVSLPTKARIHRMIGEIYYNYGKTDEALKNFEIALSYDPKVGIKRLYDKLNE
jgi:tetratricopeptide (TPR) repeat protein